MTLPYPLPVTSSWKLVDWLDQEFTSRPAAGGLATITLPELDTYTRWQLTHMVVGCTSTSTTSLRLYLDDVANNRLRDGSNSGNFDVADWPAGLMVPPGCTLIARWSGCSDGAIAALTLQGNIYRQAS